MEQLVVTPRLTLTSISTAARGSEELAWLHEWRSDEQATWWSIVARSKTLEDTESFVQHCVPLDPPDALSKRVVFAVHERVVDTTPGQRQRGSFIGVITLRSLTANDLPLPEHLGLPAPDDPGTVTVELGYSFLPAAWGKGYATESVQATFDACGRAAPFWAPYAKVYVRAIVNAENPASLRVMAKIPGMADRGVFEVVRKMWLAGKWREHHRLHIFGMFLIE